MRRGKRFLVLCGLLSLPLLLVGLSALVVDTFGEGVYVLGLGILITVPSAMSARASLTRRGWPTTNGVVTYWEVKTTPGWFGWRDPDQDRLHVAYSYTVEGEKHTGSFSCLPTNDQVLRQIGPPEGGTAITVRYNPSKPSESSVLMGPGSLNLCFLLLGLAGIVGGCYLIWK